MSQPQPLSNPEIVRPERAPEYLRAMDIDVEVLYAAVGRGEGAAASVDVFAPPMAAGLVRWMEIVASVRRGLAQSGDWVVGDRHGQPVSRHLRSGRTLTVISGDGATGDSESAFGPQTVRRKGAATAESFRPQEVLFPLSELGAITASERAAGAPTGNWVVLYRHDGERGTRLEVSRPTGFDVREGLYTGWSVRVILDDWRPGDRREPPLRLGSGVDLQLIRSVA